MEEKAAMNLENIATEIWETELFGSLEIISGDHTSEKMKDNGSFFSELTVYQKIFELIEPRICFDIGANIGACSVFFAKFCNEVYAFEPNPYLWPILLRNAGRCSGNITPFPVGLSNEAAELSFSIPLDWHTGKASFVRKDADGIEKNMKTVTSCVKTGDEVMRNNAVHSLDFIKIDTEGFESNVLLGLKESIAEYKPVIALEWNSPITKNGFKEHRLFENMFADYFCLAFGGWWNKLLYPSLSGKLMRGICKNILRVTHPDSLQKFYCASHINYEMIFLFPEKYLSILERMTVLPHGYRPQIGQIDYL